MKKNNAGFIQIILILIVIALVGGGMYYFGTLKNKSNVVVETPTNEPVVVATQKPNTPTVKPTVKPTTDPTSNWKTYTNMDYFFSFKYPSTWKEVTTKEEKERGNVGYTNRFTVIETDKNETVDVVIFDGKADKSSDQVWSKTLDLPNNKSVKITYRECMGMGCKEGTKDIVIFDQILSTFRFTK